ncbi:MAG: SRPBCC domain-containing protein [Pseudonocardiales bacterium]|nr:SRPBCC domain-containing protein [Pseudonocardiales bacterium]
MSDTRKIEITRSYDATPEQVYSAWTEPEQFQQWWTGEGFTTPISTVTMEVRPGGAWTATMKADDGSMEIPFHGVYHEVVPNEKLVYSLVDDNDPRSRTEQGDEFISVTLKAVGSKTEMTFSQVGNLPEEELPQAEEGWNSFFDLLGDHLRKVTV